MRSRQPPANDMPGNSHTITPTLAEGSSSSMTAPAFMFSSSLRSAKATRSCGPKPSKIAVLLRLVLKTVFGCSEAK